MIRKIILSLLIVGYGTGVLRAETGQIIHDAEYAINMETVSN
jgi:hypothetical protein